MYKFCVVEGHHKFYRHAGYKNSDWTDPTQCELWHEDLSRPLCEVYAPLLQSTETHWDSEFVTLLFIHQCRGNQIPVCGEPVLEAQVDSSKSLGSQDFATGLEYSQNTKNQRREL